MERRLLLLGLLRNHAMHGYQLNEMIDSHLGTTVRLKKATAYDLLKKMTAEGWIEAIEAQDGNRPTKRVYSITKEGEAAFQRMLRDILADYKPAEFLSDIGLAFMDAIPMEEAETLLEKRRMIIEALLKQSTEYEDHPGSMQWVLEHQHRHLIAELEWIEEIIRRIKKGG